MEYEEYNLDRLELSAPVQVNEFVAFGKEEFNAINELYGKGIGALENSISHELFLNPLNLQKGDFELENRLNEAIGELNEEGSLGR